ncbi:hypothetical protein PGT21_010601 [Puccinia graminis f. sp. tritici]|uniref:Uncharacterized protein n=1 Tax=Puccinia graminis f. sp. tritici TaxID=56615 RepID=A0A5B0N3P2_PUCGR|nr:hypothetical protein PGT21_010601 [Puccinia graminis f. sp. tritici]
MDPCPSTSNSRQVDPALQRKASTCTASTSSSCSLEHSTGPVKKRVRRTQEQMRVFRLEQLKKQEQVEVERLNHLSRKNSSIPGSSNPFLSPSDYELVCTYLETGDNYGMLFGDGGKSQAGRPMTKAAAFDIFATFINQRNPRLHLTGRQLQQRLSTYKHKYSKAKELQHLITQNPDMANILRISDVTQRMNEMCPCFQRLERILESAKNPGREVRTPNNASDPLSNHPQNPNEPHAASEGQSFHPTAESGAPREEHENPFGRVTSNLHHCGTIDYTSLGDQPPQQQRVNNTISLMMDQEDHVDRNQEVEQQMNPKPRCRKFKVSAGRCRSRKNITLEAAFDRNSTLRFRHLEKRLEWEKEKFSQELQFKKIELQWRETQSKNRSLLAEKWLGEGKTASEIQILLSSIYTTQEAPTSNL